MLFSSLAAAALAIAPAPAASSLLAAEMTFPVAAPRQGSAGEIRVSASPEGAVFQTRLDDIAPGTHGFHVHAGGSCAAPRNAAGETVAAGAAGPHWDPQAAAAHCGPHGDGHLADLPRIEAGRDGRAAAMLVAPRIGALKGHTIIVHDGADTYSDAPEPLGGGGRLLACGALG